MKKKRINMDKIREILRLHEELDLGVRKIADALSISKTAVSDYISGFKATLERYSMYLNSLGPAFCIYGFFFLYFPDSNIFG